MITVEPHLFRRPSGRQPLVGPVQRPLATLANAHVINLASRNDRWEKLKRHLRDDLSWDLPLTRYTAVDTREWPVESTGNESMQTLANFVHPRQMDALRRNYPLSVSDMQRGAVGCFLSHLNLWNHLWSQRDQEYMLILEDDAFWSHPSRFTMDEVNAQIAAVPNDWDILLLGAWVLEASERYANYSRLSAFWCTHSYLIHRQAVPRLTQGILPIKEPLDWVISRRAETDMKVYTLNEHLFWQTSQSGDSDISRWAHIPSGDSGSGTPSSSP